MELSLHSLTQALAVVYSCGPWLVLAAISYRMLCPYLKGGR